MISGQYYFLIFPYSFIRPITNSLQVNQPHLSEYDDPQRGVDGVHAQVVVRGGELVLEARGAGGGRRGREARARQAAYLLVLQDRGHYQTLELTFQEVY